jgi:hypothetical protein
MYCIRAMSSTDMKYRFVDLTMFREGCGYATRCKGTEEVSNECTLHVVCCVSASGLLGRPGPHPHLPQRFQHMLQ